MLLDELPRIDEHAITIAAGPEQVCDAVRATFRGSGRATAVLAGVLATEPASGFEETELDPPHRIVLRGRHRFSEYAIVVRIEPVGDHTRCRLESRGAFPGPLGAAYRLLVIGSRAHVVAVRRLLQAIQRRAERG